MEDDAKNQERIHAPVPGAGAKVSRPAKQEEKQNGIITPNLFDINLNDWPGGPSVNPLWPSVSGARYHVRAALKSSNLLRNISCSVSPPRILFTDV